MEENECLIGMGGRIGLVAVMRPRLFHTVVHGVRRDNGIEKRADELQRRCRKAA